MTTEERIQKEAKENYKKLAGAGRVQKPENILADPQRQAYVLGATKEAARNKELQDEVNRLMQFVGKCHAIETEMEILKERNKENAVAFNRWYCASDWSLSCDINGNYINTETNQVKTMDEIYDLYIESINKKSLQDYNQNK